MPIKLRVGSEFQDAEARKVLKEAQDYFKRQDIDVKVRAKMDDVSARKAANEAQRYFDRQGVKLRVETDIKDADSSIVRLIHRLNELGRATAFTGRGLGTLALPVVGLALIDIAKGAVTASQSIALLPASLSSAAAAFGTLKLATLGFGDAMKEIGDPEKFAAALQGLAPSAQQSALSIQNLLPSFKELQIATQDVFMRGFGEEIHRLTNEYLPEIRAMTTGIAGAFNEMVRGIGDQLMTPSTQMAMENMMANFATAFQELAPAARSFAQAFIDIASTGSDFLPGLARSVAEAARAFADFIREAQESGKLEEFIRNGINAVSELGSAIWELGGIIYDIFGSNGKQNVEDFSDTLEGINTIVATLGGNFDNLGADMSEEFGKMTGIAAGFRDAILDIPEAFTVVAQKVLDFVNYLSTQINRVIDAVNLINPFEDVGKLPTDLSVPSSWGGDWGSYQIPPGSSSRRPGTYRDRSGAERRIPSPGGPHGSRGTMGSAGFGPYQGPFTVPSAPAASSGSGGGGGTTRTSKFTGPMGTEPQFVDIAVIAADFGLVPVSGKRNEPGSHHHTGEALDVGMPGGGVDTPEMLAFTQFMRANYGSQLSELIYGGPGGPQLGIDEGKPFTFSGKTLGEHRNHVHIAVKDALEAYGFTPDGPREVSGPTPVTVQEFGGSAKGDLQSLFQPLAEDFGISGGLPGVVKWLTTFLGNFALAGAIRGGAFGDPAALFGGAGAPAQSQQGMFTSPSAMGPIEIQPSPQWSADWNAIAQKESGGDWGINTGNGYQGGLQFAPSSWNAAGGQQYAPAAHLATPFQQAMAAENLLKQQGPGAWPNTFTPGSAGPPPPGIGGGMHPGMGMPQAAPFGARGGGPQPGPPQPQGYVPSSGGWQPSGPGFQGVGGLPLEAASAAAGMFPGAQTGMKLANRAIGFMGQAAAIGVQGVMETFLPAGSALGDPSKSLFGRVLGGIAGARPAQENKAGQSEPAMKIQDDAKRGSDAVKEKQGGPAIGTVNFNAPVNNDQAMVRDIDRQMNSHGAGMGH